MFDSKKNKGYNFITSGNEGNEVDSVNFITSGNE